MENTDNINNQEKKSKWLIVKQEIELQEHVKKEIKIMKQRANSKRIYENDKERIIARVKANQRRHQELKQLERLHELKNKAK